MSSFIDVQELIENNVISAETAENITKYYKTKQNNEPNKLFVIFGVLGAILIGLGLILIVAHNWDNLPRLAKTIIAFVPMLVGQILCTFAYFKKQNSLAWKESTAVFLFFAVALCIALISQIYNLPGSMSSFIFTWMLLCLPLVYVMRSSIVSLFYLIGITYYAAETNYFTNKNNTINYNYWWMLLLVIPHYYYLLKEKATSNFTNFCNVLIPLSLTIALGTFINNNGIVMLIAYFSLFAIFYQLGNGKMFNHLKSRKNGFTFLGAFATIVLLLFMTFDTFWKELIREENILQTIIQSKEFAISILLTVFAFTLVMINRGKMKFKNFNLIEIAFLVFTICFFIGFKSAFPIIIMNFLVLLIGINYIKIGVEKNHLGILNFGLLTITALIICRFFDQDLSFVIRGILFVLVGIGFILTNVWMLKRRKNVLD